MTSFLVLDDEQTEILSFGLSTAIRTQRQAMAEIMRERLERAANGDKDIASWKAARLNNLLFQVSRLERLARLLDTAPGDAKPAPSD